MACDDDNGGPGDTVEEVCCACVRDNACGGPDFSFGQCVPDGYYGRVKLGIDATCVNDHSAKDCAGAQFQ